jgi:hypothetical protein
MFRFSDAAHMEHALLDDESSRKNHAAEAFDYVKSFCHEMGDEFLNIESLSPNEFINLLNSINGILRHKKGGDCQMDGEDVAAGGCSFLGGTPEYIPPFIEDKVFILGNALAAAKRMNVKKTPPQDVALMMSSVINAVHAYGDANGRTSRMLYLVLLNEPLSVSIISLDDYLVKHGNETFDPNPKFLQGYIELLLEQQIGVHDKLINRDNITYVADSFNLPRPTDPRFEIAADWCDDVTEKDKQLVEFIFQHNKNFFFLALFSLYKSKGRPQNWLGHGANSSFFNPEVIFSKLDGTDIKELLDIYRGLKREYVNTIIDIFEYPDNDRYTITSPDGNKFRLIDHYKSKVFPLHA